MDLPFNSSDFSSESNPLKGFGIGNSNIPHIANSICQALEEGAESITIKSMVNDSAVNDLEIFLANFWKIYMSCDKGYAWNTFRSISDKTIKRMRLLKANENRGRKAKEIKMKLIDEGLIMRGDFMPILKTCLPLLEDMEEYELCARVLEHIK